MNRRRWFRFSLSTFFVLLTLFGVWLGMQVKWIRERHDALEWLETHNGLVNTGGPAGFPAPWSLRMLGEPGVRSITIEGANVKDQAEREARGRELQRLFPEAEVFYNYHL